MELIYIYHSTLNIFKSMLSKLFTSFTNKHIISNIYAGKASIRFSCGLSKQIKEVISKELEAEQKNKPDYSKYHEYFKNKEWELKHAGTQIQLSRKVEEYQVRILFNARAPQTEANTQNQFQQQNESMENMGDFCDVTAYVSKTGNEWLCADFLVAEDQTQLSLLNFIKDYNLQKQQKKRYHTSTAEYIGPDVASLETSLVDGISDLLNQVGVDSQLLKKCSEYSLDYEHKFYIEWLEKFNDVL